MADNVTGLGRLSWLSQDASTPVDPKNQTKAYLEGVKSALKPSKFSSDSGKDYLDIKGPNNGLSNQTPQQDQFGDITYLDWINKNGSAIVNVNGKQIGNMDQAQTNDDKAYNAYYKHPTP